MMTLTPLNQLAQFGQSIWYDNVQRSLLTNGEIAKKIVEDRLTGLTSNPTIFNKAISQNPDYDESIAKLLSSNSRIETITLYETLAVADIQMAADLLRPVYERTNGADGFASLEVSPLLAHDTDASIEEAQRLHKALGRPNVLIKIPATPAGLPAITALIGQGISVNVTLMVSLRHYELVSEAYLLGLEKLDAAGGDLSKVTSVASFFISRVDTAFDKALESIGAEEAISLRGKVGIANTKAAYRRFEETFGSDRFKPLQAKGARYQRPLWASTGVKNPNYSDTMYVERLIGPNTINTMPPNTMEAFKDHGRATAATLTQEVDEAWEILERVVTLTGVFRSYGLSLSSPGPYLIRKRKWD